MAPFEAIDLARALGQSRDGVGWWARRGVARRATDADFAAAVEDLDRVASEEPWSNSSSDRCLACLRADDRSRTGSAQAPEGPDTTTETTPAVGRNPLTAYHQGRRLVTMEIAHKVSYWNDIADYDLETARAMVATGRWLYAVFMSQQAMEKALKAAFLALERGDEPPRTHNLSFLLDQVDCGEDSKEVRGLAVRLSAYYIEARYPSYKEKLSTLVERDEAVAVVDRTQEAISWIRSHLK